MIFAVINEHDSKKCPLKTDEGVDMLKKMFSEENIEKNDIELENAYLSCPTDESPTHKGAFIVNSDNEKNVKNFFRRLKVDIKEVMPFNKIIKI